MQNMDTDGRFSRRGGVIAFGMLRMGGMIIAILCVITCSPGVSDEPDSKDRVKALFAPDRLVAWCIVPFDAKQRGPAERAEMVSRLGMKRVAYDWRQEHVSTFEEEIQQYQQRGLEFFAFWSWHESLRPLVKKYGIRPQVWITCPSPEADTQQERVLAAAESLRSLVERTHELGLSLGLYNHGGWGGEPANLVAVCEELRRTHQTEHVGIVYNFHHGHGHIDDFAESLALMQPYILCLNINGMADEAVVTSGRDKILPIGSGLHERKMLQTVVDSGYDGPIGILDHRSELDAEESLRANLNGLAAVAADLRN
ncbi:MAG: hypothetical protein KDA93_14920 [Planctomycetaceae bacterium]|nr:hypothetical protein [Planctomycetaceae bacterium]